MVLSTVQHWSLVLSVGNRGIATVVGEGVEILLTDVSLVLTSFGQSLSAVRDAVSFVCDAFPLIRDAVSCVRDAFPLIRDAVSCVRDAFPLVRDAFALVRDTVPAFHAVTA